ncbi:MAG: hypothetical protein HQL28_05075 [Candidatus Omnitrophica bacterium]|nr:hypothetical protein [Candidatus Omnitrophota bacterium]
MRKLTCLLVILLSVSCLPIKAVFADYTHTDTSNDIVVPLDDITNDATQTVSKTTKKGTSIIDSITNFFFPDNNKKRSKNVGIKFYDTDDPNKGAYKYNN